MMTTPDDTGLDIGKKVDTLIRAGDNFPRLVAFVQRCATVSVGLRWRYRRMGEILPQLIRVDAQQLLDDIEEE